MTFSTQSGHWTHHPDCVCSKTSVGCSLQMAGTLWPESLRDWPASGTWDRTGFSPQAPLEPPTNANVSSSSPTLPTPVADNSRGLPSKGTAYQSLPNAVVALLPTPVTTDSGSNSPGDRARRSPGLRTLPDLLPTPLATDGTKGGPNQRGSKGDLTLSSAVHRLGEYAPAIERAETVLGRPAPSPTEPNKAGNPRLSAAFVEWLMMWPANHVTNQGLPRTAELRILGNGVVPLQAATAIHLLLERATS